MMGVTQLIAFVSAMIQIRGLVGENGILPVKRLVAQIKRSSDNGLFEWPSILYFNPSDSSLQSLCLLGAVTSAFIITGLVQKGALFLNTLLYLSLIHAGQVFFNHPWDSLLVEASVVAFFLAGKNLTDRYHLAIVPNQAGFWLARVLLFKVLFQAGLAKILNADTSWTSLTAFQSHFLTQPLPFPLSWYASQLPPSLLKLATAFTLVMELFFSWLILIPSSLGPWAGMIFAPMVGLQILMMLTGHCGFFYLITLSLSLMLIDDDLFHEWIPKGLFWRLYVHPYAGEYLSRKSFLAPIYLICTVILLGLNILVQMDTPLPPRLKSHYLGAQNIAGRFRLINNYDKDLIIPQARREIVVEGSNEGSSWREFHFYYKVGDPQKRPPWTLFFHLPRLDWQIWSAAQDPEHRPVWIKNLFFRLLEGSYDVHLLLDLSEEHTPPKFLRAILYDYQWSVPTLKKKGIWWIRSPMGSYQNMTTLGPLEASPK